MVSQLDLDQGGTDRQIIRKYLGPSVGWVAIPDNSFWPVIVGGTTTLLLGTTLVPVSYDGDGVNIVLPPVSLPNPPAGVLPIPYARLPLTVYDAGGFAGDHPITLTPADGETIMGLSSIQIAVAFGGWSLMPHPENSTWVTISG